MNEYKKPWTKPRTGSKLIKSFRQILVFEYSNERLYKSYFKSIHSTSEVDAILNKVATEEEKTIFYDMVENSDGMMPYQYSIYQFIKKYDANWYNDNYLPK